MGTKRKEKGKKGKELKTHLIDQNRKTKDLKQPFAVSSSTPPVLAASHPPWHPPPF